MSRLSGRLLTLMGIAVVMTLLLSPGLIRAEIFPSEAETVYQGLKVYHIQMPDAPPETKTVSLFSWSLRETDIRDVLLTFAKGSGYNIAVEPGVEGKVTLDLNMVSFEQALKYLLKPLGLEYKWEENFVRVFNPRFITRIFHLDYVNVQRSGQGSLTISSEGGYSSSIENTTSMDTWTTVIDGLVTIIFGGEGGGAGEGGAFSHQDSQGRKLIVNPQSGVILVTAIEEKLQEVAKFLEAVQSAIRRQVMIQAKIVEVALSDDFQLGINWANITDFADWTKLAGTLAGGTGLVQQTFNNASGTFQFGVANDHISVLLDAMATQGKLNVLSSPQIVALNNQTAMIKVAQEAVYYEITTQTETTEQIDRVIETSTPVTIDVGIVLYVTPQIGADGSITLNIHPSISEITGEAVSRLGDTKPIIERRETNTMVKIRDGQTIVMAGLIKNRTSEDLKMVPCLGNIPLLGYLFRHTEKKKGKSELVVMLTPTILKDNGLTIVKEPQAQDIEKLSPKDLSNIPIIVDRIPDISLNKPLEEHLAPVSRVVRSSNKPHITQKPQEPISSQEIIPVEKREYNLFAGTYRSPKKAKAILEELKLLGFKPYQQSIRAMQTVYIVYVGCFTDYKSAQKLQKRLEKEGFDTYLPVTKSKEYRIQTGVFAHKPYAQNLLRKVQQKGHKVEIETDQMPLLKYEIIIGSFKTYKEAKFQQNALKAKNIETLIRTNDKEAMVLTPEGQTGRLPARLINF